MTKQEAEKIARFFDDEDKVRFFKHKNAKKGLYAWVKELAKKLKDTSNPKFPYYRDLELIISNRIHEIKKEDSKLKQSFNSYPRFADSFLVVAERLLDEETFLNISKEAKALEVIKKEQEKKKKLDFEKEIKKEFSSQSVPKKGVANPNKNYSA